MPSGPLRDWWVSLLDSAGAAFSGSNPLPTSSAPVVPTATGTISSSAGPTSIVQLVNTVGASVVSIALQSASFTGTVQFEVSNDGTNYVGVTCVDSAGTNAALNAVSLGPGAVNQMWSAPIQGAAYFRVRCNAYTSGTLTVTLFAGYGDALSAVMAQLTTAATTANPKAVLATAAYLIGSTGAASERIRTVAGASALGVGTQMVATGIPPVTSLNAVAVTGPGTIFNLGVAHSNISMQVSGTGTGITVVLEGSMDGANWNSIASAAQNTIVSAIAGTAVSQIRANLTARTAGNVTAILAAA